MSHILLLAEPSLTIQRVVQLTFANEDIDVVIASDGAEAIEQAERIRPSIVLADVALARQTGYDVAAHFKRTPKFAGIPVVLLSGAFERVDSARAAEAGCDLVLSKPFEPRHLLAHVRELMGVQPAADRAVASAAVTEPAVPGGLEAADVPALPRVAPPIAAPMRVAVEPPAPAIVHSEAEVAPTPTPTPDPEPLPPMPAPPAIAVEAEPVVVSAAQVFAEEPVVDTPESSSILGLPTEWTHQAAPQPEPVPSFEILSLTNKSMHLVPPRQDPDADIEFEREGEPAPEPTAAPRSGGHDLGNLIPALDDYFDQLDAAFASGGDSAFRRPLDVPPPAIESSPRHAMVPPPAAPPEAVLPPVAVAPAAVPPIQTPAPVAPPSAHVRPVEDRRDPAHSPFSTLRLESPVARPVPPAAPPASPAVPSPLPVAPPVPTTPTIDDAYDALMKQLREPRPRPSVVALRADDELLVERAVERVLAQLDSAVLREALTDVVTSLAKKVIQDEIERIRRP